MTKGTEILSNLAQIMADYAFSLKYVTASI
jgi:hypothetical protein